MCFRPRTMHVNLTSSGAGNAPLERETSWDPVMERRNHMGQPGPTLKASVSVLTRYLEVCRDLTSSHPGDESSAGRLSQNSVDTGAARAHPRSRQGAPEQGGALIVSQELGREADSRIRRSPEPHLLSSATCGSVYRKPRPSASLATWSRGTDSAENMGRPEEMQHQTARRASKP